MNRRRNLFWTIPLLLLFSACKKELVVNDEGNLVPKTVVSDAALPSIMANGATFHAETFGDPSRKMLVILHGGPGNDYRYLLNCKAFANEGYYVVFYDQRGSGLSERFSKDSYSINLMLDDLGAIIAHYRTSGAQKVFLLGHSWGAMLVTAYINKYPTAISGAILGEPGGFVWQDVKDYVTRSRDYRFSSETLNDASYLDQFLTGSENDQAVLDYKLGLLSASDASPDSPIGNDGVLPYWRAGAVINRALFDLGEKEKPDFTTNLQQYTTPVLFCYSERNKAYGLAHAQKVSSAYPHVQLEMVKDAGHDFISSPEGWNNFFPVALTYLNSL